MDWNNHLPAEHRTQFFEAFRDNLDLVLDILHSMDAESREVEELNAAALASFATTYGSTAQPRP